MCYVYAVEMVDSFTDQPSLKAVQFMFLCFMKLSSALLSCSSFDT